MNLPKNSFKADLGNKMQFGFWLSLMSPVSSEIAAGAGFDWVLIDMEHSPNEITSVADQIRAIEAVGDCTSIVRPPGNDPVVIKRLLDIGAQCLLIPYIESVEQARAAVQACCYAPAGRRGFSGTTRANRYGRVSNYCEKAREEIAVILQIESQRGLDNLREISKLDGVDAIFIGPADLAVDMGAFGNYRDKDIWQAVKTATADLKSLGVPCGTLLIGDDALNLAADLDLDFLAMGSDTGILARSTEALVSGSRN